MFNIVFESFGSNILDVWTPSLFVTSIRYTLPFIFFNSLPFKIISRNQFASGIRSSAEIIMLRFGQDSREFLSININKLTQIDEYYNNPNLSSINEKQIRLEKRRTLC